MTITEEDVDKALAYLRDTAITAAQARANRLYLEQYLKTVKAEQQSSVLHINGKDMSVAQSELFALDSQAYRDILTAYKEAITEDEKHRFLREAASARIEAWRTMCSNERASRV